MEDAHHHDQLDGGLTPRRVVPPATTSNRGRQAAKARVLVERIGFRIGRHLTLAVLLCGFASSAAAQEQDYYLFKTAPPLSRADVFVDGVRAGETDENGQVLMSGAESGLHEVRVQIGDRIHAPARSSFRQRSTW